MHLNKAQALAAVASLLREAVRGDGHLGAAAAHHLASGGAAWRADLALDCAGVLGLPQGIGIRLAAACELVHQASIVHDDVQDEAIVRRGRPSVAACFGAPTTICLGDALLAAAFGVASELPRAAELVRFFAARVQEAAAGQAEEFSPGLWQAMTPDRYRALVESKAGAMIALPVMGTALLAGLPGPEVDQAGRAARAIGAAYQASDDLQDLEADLARGALNGVVAFDLHSRTAVGRRALLGVLDRAREEGLRASDVAREAQRLRRTAPEFVLWALGLLAGAEAEQHALQPVIARTAAQLANRLAPARLSADAA